MSAQVVALLALTSTGSASFELASDPAMHPASSSRIIVGNAGAGNLGQVHPAVAAHFDVPAETFVADLDWETLVQHALAVKQLRGVPKFPAVARDLAFVVDAAVPAERLLAEIRAADRGKLLEQVTLFDVYRGPPVPDGRKSVAFGLSLRAPDRTLTDAEADALTSAIRDRLKSTVGAEIRA